MSSTVLGLLDFYCSESDSSLYSTFQLKKGETTIGSSSKCDITLAYPNISAEHCKITLLDNSEFSIEDLGSTNGIYRLTLDCSQQLLRPNKEYELIPDRPFYIANRYKCVFKLAQLKEKMEVEEKEEPSEIKLESNEDNLIDSSLLLTSRSALKRYREEMKRVLESERKAQSQARRQSSPKGKEDTKKKQSSKKSEKKTGKPDENLSKSKSSSEKMTVEQEITSEVERKKQEANKTPKSRAKSQKSSTKDSSSKGIEAQEKDVIKTKSSEGKQARSKSKVDFADNEESKDDNKKTKSQLKKKSEEKSIRENTPKKGKDQSKKGSKEKDKISPSSTKGSEDNDQPSLENSSEKKKGKRRGNKEELNQFEKASTSSKKIKFEDKPVDASPRRLRSSLKSPSRVSSASKQSLSSKSSLSKSSNEKGNRSTSKWNGENGFETPKRDAMVSKKNALQVAFSGIEEIECEFKEDKKKLGNLGVKIIDEKDQKFTVLVMKKFKRTMKFLIALSRGIDIVDYRWVKDSIKEGKSLPVENYIFVDNPAEIKFKFNLMESLQKAKQRREGLLEGYRLYISGDIKPSYDEVRLVIESTGGSLIRTKPVSYKDNVLILLNTYDEKNLKYFEEVGYSPYATELVFSGILKQKMDFGSNTL